VVAKLKYPIYNRKPESDPVGIFQNEVLAPPPVVAGAQFVMEAGGKTTLSHSYSPMPSNFFPD
jgi:hypothetical protein